MIAAAAFLLMAQAAPLADPALEARARALEGEIRCVQCENEPISQSTAEIAGDMRAYVRERVAAGDTDGQIRAYFARRYGEFVLLRPPVNAETFLLWGAPVLLLALGGLALLGLRRRGPPGAPDSALEDPGLHDEI